MWYEEVVIETGVNVVRRDEDFWLTESDWGFKKVFHTVFDVLVTHEVFCSLTVFAFEGKENALLFCHNWQLLFSKQLSYLRPIFVNLSTEDFLDLSTENRKFWSYCIRSLFGQWNESKEFSKQLSFSGSKVHPLKRNIKDRQRIYFLFVDWANWKFFFFFGKNVSCLNCSFLPLKERF